MRYLNFSTTISLKALWRWPVLLACATLIIYGCGGGGGGGSSITYTGSTSQATITDGNAETLAKKAYGGGGAGTTLSLGVAQPDNTDAISSRLVALSRILQSTASQIDIADAAGVGVSSAVYTDTGTIIGNCPGSEGSVTISATVDTDAGNFSGTATFNSYCDNGTTINGSASVSGTYRETLDGIELITFNFSFSALTVSSTGESVTVNGNVSINATGSPVTVSMNMDLRDNTVGKIYRVANYHLEITEGVVEDIVDISGTFYHPDHGYVSVWTEVPIVIGTYDEYPSSGTLVVVGSGGTSAKLIFINNTTYQVTADTNGNGLYDDPEDYDSGPTNWDGT